MLFDPKHGERLDGLEARLRGAPVITPELMSGAIAHMCTRHAALNANTRAKLKRLIDAGAWTDAALALVEIELPHWKLRRLVFEDGEWFCFLSRQPQLPLGLDEAAEASHAILPLAILLALLEARRAAAAPATAVLQLRPAAGSAMCCDNFS